MILTEAIKQSIARDYLIEIKLIQPLLSCLTFLLKSSIAILTKECWDVAQHDSSLISQKANKILDIKTVLSYDTNVHF